MAFSADYDMIQINTAKSFAVLFFDEISGSFYDPLNVEIEIGQFCNNVFIRILKDPMIKVDIGNYTYSTLITPNVYPVNQLFFVYFTFADSVILVILGIIMLVVRPLTLFGELMQNKLCNPHIGVKGNRHPAHIGYLKDKPAFPARVYRGRRGVY